MKIAFVLSHVPNPRMYKRINALKELGDITVICVRRLNQDVYSLINIENVEFRIKELIVPPFSKTMRRMWVNRRIASFITKSLNEIRPDIIYTAGLDNLQIVYTYTKKHQAKVVYEVADLRESFINNVPKSF